MPSHPDRVKRHYTDPPRIAKNSATCLTCGVTIESRSVHDFVECRCRDERTRIFVDGGHNYARRGFGPLAVWVESDGHIVLGGPEAKMPTIERMVID